MTAPNKSVQNTFYKIAIYTFLNLHFFPAESQIQRGSMVDPCYTVALQLHVKK